MGSNDTEFDIIRYPLVDSTNRIALEIGLQNTSHPIAIQADEQSTGQGRDKRSFFSPRGGLYMSAVFRPQLSIKDFPLVTLAAGVATAEAVELITGVSVQLKWPNDLYHGVKKVGGILTEAAPYSPLSANVPFVVVGVGLNVNTPSEFFPDPLRDRVTSLYSITGQEFDISVLARSLMHTLLSEISLLQDCRAEALEHWRQRDLLFGRTICWLDPAGRRVQGRGGGLLEDGRYRLTSTEGEEYYVVAGDIVITDMSGQK